MKTKVYMQCLLHIVCAGMIYLIFSSNVAFQPGDIQPRDVLSDSTYTYTGWAGNPDSLTVFIDDTFSEQEKDSVRVAIQRWNDVGCTPALKEVDEGPANVTVTEGDPGVDPETGIQNAGLYEWDVDDDGKMHGGVITIRNDPNPGLVETATHELGHALGLDDTDPDDNPSDVMKGSGPPNGTNGELSEHDLAEMQAAAAVITAEGEEADEDIYAVEPVQAITPGEFSILTFDLPFDYLPGEFIMYDVNPIANHLLAIEFTELFENTLLVGVYLEPNHWSGKIYFQISIFIDADHYQYRGIHFVSQNPVPPIDFECPFNAVVDGNQVLVQWNGLHTYPFDRPLRSTLSVNGNRFYKVKPSSDAPPGYFGDYTITLEPGIHELTLVVDDYQVNRASFSMDIFIEEPPPPPPPEPYFELIPNGKTNPEDWYRWITGMDGETPVPLLTNVPEDITAARFYFSFDPTADVWIEFWEDLDGTSNAAPGEPGSYGENHDGWCGYLHHEMLGDQTTEVFFKAEVEGLDGIIHVVLSETSLLYTLTPPSAFQITTDGGIVIDDIFVTDQPQLSLQFDPAHDNFDYAQFQVTETLDSIYDKNIPHIQQTNDYYCGPAALAMCLKYFAGQDKMNMKDPTGGLSDAALMDSLAKYCGTKPSNGTTEGGMVSGANEWIKKQGGGYTVQDFKDFDKFGIKEMVKHLKHDGKQNGVSQNIISLFRLITLDGDTMNHFMTLSSTHKTEAGYNRFDYEDPVSVPTNSKVAFDIDENGVASNPTFADGEPIENYPYQKVELLSSMMICPIETQVTSSGGEITQGPDFPGVEIEVPEGLAGARVRAVDNNGKKHERDILIRRVNPPVCPGDINAPLNGPPFQLPPGQPGGGTFNGPHIDTDGWFWPIEEGIYPVTYTVDYDGFEFSCEFIVMVIPYDFGDAPDPPYPTLLASDGARHIIDGVTFLGQSVDPEPDGQPNNDATGDDNDDNNDDDGVTFGEIMVGSAAQVEVTTSVAGYLQGWMDFNADGDWDDPSEQIFIDEFIHFGQTVCLNYEVPADATPGLTFTRFRFSTQPNIGHSGLAEDGEVEDYQVLIIENPEYKWAQEPCEQLSGLHCHDYEIEGTYNLPVLADDWLCNSGQVTEIQWWGNYEEDAMGDEMRFSGIKKFQLSIFDHQPDGCLPVTQPAWTATVALTAANETPTGLFDGEGGIIYAYSYTLSIPFDQIEGNQYWLGMTTVANNPVAPPHWRWQESSRSVSTVLCPASSRLNNSPWQHYTWPGLDPVRFSQMAFGIISGDYVPPEPPTADLIPKGKTNPEPWYRWITDPDGVTPVLLLTDDPNAIDKVSFYYSDDPALSDWTLFYEDEDGTSNAAPGEPGSESPENDGWCGYLDHELLGQNPAELFFKAEVETTSGALFDVLSEISLFYTLTPPDDFLITTSEGHVIEKEYVTDQFPLTLYFTPQHENFDYAQVQQSEDLPLIYDKEIPQIMQPNNYYCGPASLAMCLKYFANTNETLYGHVTGDLSDTALMDSLANRCGTISPTGTTKSGMVSGVTKWIDKQGGGFTVQGFKNFSEFGKDSLVKHLLHDGLQNNVSQNIISRFMLIKYNEVTQKDDTLYHYMTLSSVHEKDIAYKRFDYADPMIPPGVGRLAFDLDDEGVAGDFKFHDGGEIENFPYKKVQLLSSMMICPKETSIVPDEGETTEGPEFTPIESDVPEGSSRATRVRAVDNDGNKHETDIILRRAPTPVCQDEIFLPLGGPPHELDGCTPGGGTFDGPNITDGWFIPIEEGTFTITYTVTFYGFETSCEFYVTVYALDYGDAPDEFYPTLLTSDGARHGISSNLFMGQLVDPEPDGQPCPFALGDDQDGTDDEDGVRFLGSFVPGETVTVEFTVHGTGYINAWIDWEINGNWDGPDDHVIQNFHVTSGVHQHDIIVPANAAPGFTFSRFRISSFDDLDYFGQAFDGEVEDYKIKIHEPLGHKMHYPQYPDPAGWDVKFNSPIKLADDWMCSETGYVEDISFWVSWLEDITPVDMNLGFVIEIYSDIPANESSTGYSMPGTLLWSRDFAPGQYDHIIDFEHPQGWFDPVTASYETWDHQNCYRINMNDIQDPFIQEAGTIYWLVITAETPSGIREEIQIGWKSSPDHFQDVAVWQMLRNPWLKLHDSITEDPLSLAFVISGSPYAPPEHDVLFSQDYYDGGNAVTSALDPIFPIDFEAADNFFNVTGMVEEVVFYGLALKMINGFWQEQIPGVTEPFFIRFYDYAESIAPGLAAPVGGTYQVALLDGWGDGWDDASVSVFVNGAAVLINITLTAGYGPAYFSFYANAGDFISTEYIPGSWPDENYYAIIDPGDNVIAEDGGTWDNHDAEAPTGIAAPGDVLVHEPDWPNPVNEQLITTTVQHIGPIFNNQFQLYKFTAPLTTPVLMTNGWISAQIDVPNGSGTWFLWLNSADGDDIAWQRTGAVRDHKLSEMPHLSSFSLLEKDNTSRSMLTYDLALELWGDELSSFIVLVDVQPEDGGRVLGAGEYATGATVNLTAFANIGYQFVEWTEPDGTHLSDQLTYSFVMPDYDVALTAHFEADPVVPTDFYLAPLGKINPDPWYRWISDPDGVTRVNLLTGYPADQVVSVDFYYSMYVDKSLWTWFYTDTDGTSNAAPGDPETESELNDGWSGYLPHEMLDVGSAELHFKAILTLSELEAIEVVAPFTLNYTATPPNAFVIIDENEVLVEDIYYTDQEHLSLFFVPLHDYFGDVMFQTKQELPAEYDKGTPFISQPDSITCGPAAAAMCLKYFAELSPEQYGHIVGEYTDAELVEALSEYFDTKSPTGTYTDKMEKGFKDWIDNHGGGFQTEGFKPFSEFGIEDMVKHLLHDYKQNNVSQNIISRFRIVGDDGKVFYHYMTLSSVHEVPGQGYTRFNYMDPADPNDPSDPGIGKVFFDIDANGNATNITYADGEIITDYAEMKLLESMMICPKEAAILPPPEEGEITENPGSPVEIEIELPQEGSSGLRARATDQDGNKHETDIVVRRTAPATCPDDITVGLGDPPITLAGGTPPGGTYSGPHVVNGVFHPVETGEFLVTYAVLYPTGFLTDCDFTITVTGYDFGDAPDGPYPTLLVSNGARHQVGSGLYLGQLIDPEPDGQPCPFALGDDRDGNDDEDGIRFLDSFLPGQTVRIEATVHGTGYLNAWFDWNANGSWGDPFEHGIVNQPVTTGVHQFNVTVPVNAAPGFTFARFRLTSQPGLSFQGSAPDGEVEDYRILINEPMEHKMHYPQYPDPAGWDVYMPTLYHIYQIGDDWMCSETGYVEDIHFWVSWKEDIVPQNLDIEFHVRIFSDIPAADSYTGYSVPGTLLWQRTFAPGSYIYEEVFEHPQGWLRPIPPNAGHSLWDHEICYKVDILNIPDPFLQTEGTVYWLVLSADMSETVPQIGWKTSLDHFNDVAVWYNPPSAWGWELLFDPVTQEHLSLAFVINGSPVPPTYNLIVVAEPTYAGVVLGGGSFPEGEIVPIDATANEGYVFVEWSDDDGNTVSTAESFDYLMPGHDVTLTANFVEQLIPVNLVLTDEEFVAGDEVCYEALESIILNNTVVESGASVELVAGELICILPDTHIETGALFHARIDEDGSFCGDLKAIVAMEEFITMDEELTVPTLGKMDSFFKVYPNPTDGIFTLELLTDVDTGSIQVEVFALHGTRVLHQQLPPQPIHLVDLTHFQPGMYIIRVTAGDHSGFERLIKK